MRNAPRNFALPLEPRFEIIADIDAPSAERAVGSLGFARSSEDWRNLVIDPAVDVVSITTPNSLHKPMALAALAAGKAVWCEKPLAATPADANEMADAAAKTIVGFSYLRNPLVGLAQQIVDSGKIGEPVGFRGIHLEDYMSDPAKPWSFRLDATGGHDAIADIGSHIISIARHLMGEIQEASGQVSTLVKHRPISAGSIETRAVEVDDQARALLRFVSGATGSIETSWMAHGRKLTLAFELTGTKGTILLGF
jgi:predicted dehydrogenase